jgi:hypothetical protein
MRRNNPFVTHDALVSRRTPWSNRLDHIARAASEATAIG